MAAPATAQHTAAMEQQPTTVARLAATTPRERDRLVDLVRAASIGVVVLGHWTMAALEPVGDDALRVRNVLEVATWAQSGCTGRP